MNFRMPVLLTLLLMAPLPLTAQQPPQSMPESLEELQAAIVIGDSPGPALWKVTHRDNTLWILPLFGPLPDGLRWRYQAVNEVISNSQAVYVGGRAPRWRCCARTPWRACGSPRMAMWSPPCACSPSAIW